MFVLEMRVSYLWRILLLMQLFVLKYNSLFARGVDYRRFTGLQLQMH